MPRDKGRIEDRNANLYRRYKTLYDEKRKRYDDVLQLLADEFYLTPATVHRIILAAAPPRQPAGSLSTSQDFQDTQQPAQPDQ